jgi:hypothetical protein
MLIKDNKKAFILILYLVMFGVAIVGVSTILFASGYLNNVIWMVLVGTGLYIGYVPYNAILFDRMIAAFKYVSTVGFIMYVADAFGYLGSVGIYFYKNFFSPDISWLNFFTGSGYIVSALGIIFSFITIRYFRKKLKNQKS